MQSKQKEQQQKQQPESSKEAEKPKNGEKENPENKETKSNKKATESEEKSNQATSSNAQQKEIAAPKIEVHDRERTNQKGPSPASGQIKSQENVAMTTSATAKHLAIEDGLVEKTEKVQVPPSTSCLSGLSTQTAITILEDNQVKGEEAIVKQKLQEVSSLINKKLN